MNPDTLTLPTVHNILKKSALLFLTLAVTELSLVLLLLVLEQADNIVHHLFTNLTIHSIGIRSIHDVLLYFLWSLMKITKAKYLRIKSAPRSLIKSLFLISMLMLTFNFLSHSFDVTHENQVRESIYSLIAENVMNHTFLFSLPLAIVATAWIVFIFGLYTVQSFMLLSITLQLGYALYKTCAASRQKDPLHLPH